MSGLRRVARGLVKRRGAEEGEGFNFDQRKNVVQYDDVMNRHRKATYIIRREILKDKDISKRIKIFIEDEAKLIAKSPQSYSKGFDEALAEVFPFDDRTMDEIFEVDHEKFAKTLVQKANELYEKRESVFGKEVMRAVEREIYLQILDNLWMQHLESMNHLREGINWISVGQKDPLVLVS